jgi:UPF0716 protein FxsA
MAPCAAAPRRAGSLMTLVLALLFLIIPIAELYVLVQVAGSIGVLNSLGLLVLISVGGAWLAKWAGLGVLRRLQATVAAGKVPSAELVDGFLVLLAAALMLTPGFLTDALALVLLLPPTRAVVRGALIRRFRQRAEVYVTGGTRTSAFFSGRFGAADVRDVAGWDAPSGPSSDPRSDPRPGPRGDELGP